MIVLHNRTLYRCDYCMKHRLTKAAAVRHELFCRYNPNNRHKCFDCEHLVRTDAAAAIGADGELKHEGRQAFTCAKFGHDMYTYVAERRKIVEKLGDVIRMPLECSGHEYETFNSNIQDLPF